MDDININGQLVEIEGEVVNVVFQNEDTGFTVLNIDYDNDYLCVVGEMPEVAEGERLKLTGKFTTHPTYGLQFKAQIVERKLPAGANAIQKYLASGVIKGIGKVIAKKIVDKFGDDTLLILEETPERLSEVDGISKAKNKAIIDQLKNIFGFRTLMMFLTTFTITPMQSIAIYKKWGNLSKKLIEENPYILCFDDFGIPFTVVDAIAKKQNIAPDSPARILAATIYVLNFNTTNGHTCLPKKKTLDALKQLLSLDDLSDDIEKFIEDKSLYQYTYKSDDPDETRQFLVSPDYYFAEMYIKKKLEEMSSSDINSTNTYSNIDDKISSIETEKNIEYDHRQRKAIKDSFDNNLFILTGGPGTGKTTTLNGIISLLESYELNVLVCAPTGRAAKRASELTGKDAKTIHRMLEVEYSNDRLLTFSKNESNMLDCDAVVIDEMSMVDTMLFHALLKSLKPTTKLIMVGDFNQLPSVGAGNILYDLILSKSINTVALNHIFRQAATSLIVTNAHKIIAGDMPILNSRSSDFFFLNSLSANDAVETIVSLCHKRLPKSYNFDPLENIQVLSPTRKGNVGTVELNNHLQEVLNKKSSDKAECKTKLYTFREGDKVMQIKNNYDIIWSKEEESGKGVYNGDIGMIKMIDQGSKTVMVNFDGKEAFYAFDMLNELELAYPITVHKSQGSEFDAVIIPIIGGFDKLYYRNLLYTAVTRAKKILIIVGKYEKVANMVGNNHKTLRYTGLRLMYNDNFIIN